MYTDLFINYINLYIYTHNIKHRFDYIIDKNV